ncbi:MAG: ATP-binding protein [Chloroflexota bacterium]|nr:ATP-binding protein [Chloroflexota bacterium]MDE2941833.1 ATP-binding protein [Chloroflexota bacterium]MDE3266856.1 ATP-binding protein [Chloroflexota bacterium]
MDVETRTQTPETESEGDRGLHYPDLKIASFRGIKELHIPRLGRVNLITGKNNTGKSSVLEALRLHAQNGSPQTIGDILAFREELPSNTERREPTADLNGTSPVSALFHGFPLLWEEPVPIAISTNIYARSSELGIRMGRFVEEVEEDGARRLIELKEDYDPESEHLVALIVETEEGAKPPIRLERLRPSRASGSLSPARLLTAPRTACVFVSPYSAERTDALARLWDAVALTEDENQVVEALRIIEPGISAVTMVGDDGYRASRRAMTRLKGMLRPVPLRSLGDGVNRLFSIALSLVNAKGGILLIDEFENGLHYTAQPDVWRMIFELAGSLDVQVFATTHSSDTVKGFQQAAAESPEEGMLLRLVRANDITHATLANEDDLEIVTRGGIEVR